MGGRRPQNSPSQEPKVVRNQTPDILSRAEHQEPPSAQLRLVTGRGGRTLASSLRRLDDVAGWASAGPSPPSRPQQLPGPQRRGHPTQLRSPPLPAHHVAPRV